MTAQATSTVGSWHDGQVLDVFGELRALAERTVIGMMFPDELAVHAQRQALDAASTLARNVFRHVMLPEPLRRLPLPSTRRRRRARAHLREVIGSVVAARHGGDNRDLLSLLLTDANTGAQAGPPDDDLVDQVLTFFLAGSETVAVAVAWALHELGRHPEIEHRLHTEVDATLAGDSAGFEHLPRLQLTRQIITEILRLYPPVWLVTRVATADVPLGKYRIPAGTNLVYSPFIIHRRPDLYRDPNRFDPDRWSDGIGAHRQTYIPFGAGARKCIGDQVGMTEAILTLATIASRWRLQPIPGRVVRPALRSALEPNALRMRVNTRTP